MKNQAVSTICSNKNTAATFDQSLESLNSVAWSAIQIAIRRRDLWCVLTYYFIRSARSSVPAAPRLCLSLHATLFRYAFCMKSIYAIFDTRAFSIAKTLLWFCYEYVIAVLIGFAVGCGSGGVQNRAAIVPMRTFSVSEDDSPLYKTESSPRAEPVDAREQKVREAIEAGSESAGRALAGDGRLDELASWVLGHLGTNDQAPPQESIDFATHHFGIPEPTPHFLIFGSSDDNSAAREIEKRIPEAVARQAYTHYGEAIKQQQGFLLVVVVFSWRWFQMSEIPRSVDANKAIRMKGRLSDGYRNPAVVVRKPDGTTIERKEGRGPGFDLSIPIDHSGVYRVELMAEGTLGPTVLANFPIYAGIPIPRQIEVVDNSGQQHPLDRAAFTEQLFGLTNQTRSQAHLKPLRLNVELSDAAQAHCEDMDRNGFIGHQSPRTGGAADRIKKAGIITSTVRENIGRGYSAEEVHAGLIQSPAHRTAILSPDVTDIGIGMVRQEEEQSSAYLVTELFIRVVGRIDVNGAPGDVLDILNRERESRDMKEVDSNENLAKYAQQAADAYFKEQNITEKALTLRVSQKLSKVARDYKQIATLFKLADSLEQVKDVSRLFDPSLTTVGIGVAQGTRNGEMPNSIAIVVVMGWQR
jgi:uncharacterized protein YkwD